MRPPHMRAKFDSLDVVQTVWTELWEWLRRRGWTFDNANKLRAFRNRLIDRIRQHRNATRLQRPMELATAERMRHTSPDLPAAHAEGFSAGSSSSPSRPAARHELRSCKTFFGVGAGPLVPIVLHLGKS